MASHTRLRQSFSQNKCDRHLTLTNFHWEGPSHVSSLYQTLQSRYGLHWGMNKKYSMSSIYAGNFVKNILINVEVTEIRVFKCNATWHVSRVDPLCKLVYSKNVELITIKCWIYLIVYIAIYLINKCHFLAVWQRILKNCITTSWRFLCYTILKYILGPKYWLTCCLSRATIVI